MPFRTEQAAATMSEQCFPPLEIQAPGSGLPSNWPHTKGIRLRRNPSQGAKNHRTTEGFQSDPAREQLPRSPSGSNRATSALAMPALQQALGTLDRHRSAANACERKG